MIEMTKKVVVIGLSWTLVLLSLSLYLPLPRRSLKPSPFVSLSLVDRHDTLLREALSEDGGRCRWVELGEVSPDLVRATVIAEDRGFFLHPGVNPFAVVRALFQNIRSGKVVSGASTITQQVVRNIFRQRRRTIFVKLYEAWLAIRLENTLSKQKILTQYLNRIYYGNQVYGIDAAARLYFDKSPLALSLAEASFLASLPRSPNALDPYRHFKEAKKRQEWILLQMVMKGNIAKDRWKRAKQEPLRITPIRNNFQAPHFCDFVLWQVSPSVRRTLSRIRTTLDYDLQKKIEMLVDIHIANVEEKNISNAAVIVLDNANGEILSMIGSRDFFDERHDGQVNGTLSLRQPGSTLKPFTYSLALERGMTAAELMEDRDFYFSTPEGSYSPRNYDEKFHGAVRLRHALACSYNATAVSLLERLGPDLLYQRLKELGFESLDKSPVHYGVGLTLGNGEVTLLELTRAYSALARGGLYRREKSIISCFDAEGKAVMQEENGGPRRVFSDQIAFIISDILSDKDARIPAFGYLSPLNLPFDCAVKTGTSVDFRDNWTIGYTPRYTVGVWVGNFDAEPMHNISGVSGCGPLFKDIMLLLENRRPEVKFAEVRDVVKAKICPLTGKLSAEHCPGAMEDIFIEGTEPKEYCQDHAGGESPTELRIFREDEFRIAFPLDRDTFKIDPVLRPEFQTIKLKATIPKGIEIDSVEWWVNDQKICSGAYPYDVNWQMKHGQHTIKAIAVGGQKRLKTPPIQIKVK